MKGTITWLVHAATFILCSINGHFVDAVSMNAENVCPVEEELVLLHIYRASELSLQKHEQPVVLHTTRPCWDVLQGFRCEVKTSGTKLSYKTFPIKKKIVVYKCCPGYYETPLEICQVCSEGYYGNNCGLRCNCSDSEICDNVVGCCDHLAKPCRVMRSAAMKEYAESNRWVFAALLASLLAVVLLSFGTMFYRRKELLTHNELEAREFNNPMYHRSALEVLPIKISDEPVPVTKSAQLRNSSFTHEYATLDYAVPPPIMDNSLKSAYEVPLHSTSPADIGKLGTETKEIHTI
ncbi:unnamed protein product [Litomosoides sigmodontis]|uniref:EMI domain-containing protein n=1 Tax=Litomosoides sigmodontis TaxID=42156 RepID=A0A3P6T5P4_LITSI|nr:unnamed protein product [Litomosoides sigmodontis]